MIGEEIEKFKMECSEDIEETKGIHLCELYNLIYFFLKT